MIDGRPISEYTVNVSNYDVSSHVHSFYHHVFEVYNKNTIADTPKTTIFENPETRENRSKENTKGKED